MQCIKCNYQNAPRVASLCNKCFQDTKCIKCNSNNDSEYVAYVCIECHPTTNKCIKCYSNNALFIACICDECQTDNGVGRIRHNNFLHNERYIISGF